MCDKLLNRVFPDDSRSRCKQTHAIAHGGLAFMSVVRSFRGDTYILLHVSDLSLNNNNMCWPVLISVVSLRLS